MRPSMGRLPSNVDPRTRKLLRTLGNDKNLDYQLWSDWEYISGDMFKQGRPEHGDEDM